MQEITVGKTERGFEATFGNIWRCSEKKPSGRDLNAGTDYYRDLVITVKSDLWDLEIKIDHKTTIGTNGDIKVVMARMINDGNITYSVSSEKADWLMKVTPTQNGVLKLDFPDASLRLMNQNDVPVFQMRRRIPVSGTGMIEVRETEAGSGIFAARTMEFGEVSRIKIAELVGLRRGTTKEVAPAARTRSRAPA
jgi:hypothetical protein